MNPEAYTQMAETESRHWWFVGRRSILSSAIECLRLPSNARVLEVGCGTGGNLSMLGRFGRVSAIEMDSVAIELAQKKTGGDFEIKPGCCPDDIPFGDSKFDLICLFDVLEHIDDDIGTLTALRKLMAPGGRVLLTVPAYKWLWGAHDEFLHHKRRYSGSGLRNVIESSGLRVSRITNFNTLLFPLVAAVRLKDALLKNKAASGTLLPPPLLNSVLGVLFSAERFLLKYLKLPYGVSILAVASID